MPTWQIFPDAGNTFRWVISGQDPPTDPNHSRKTPIHRQNSAPRLPSMEDLLLQRSSQILQKCDNRSSPMFRTGLGKSVEVKRDSVLKAMSVLGEGDIVHNGPLKVLQNNEKIDENPPMFRTGLGNLVEVKRSSITKALSVLGDGDAVDTGSSKVLHNNGKIDENPPMFRTGLGNSVEVKRSSVMKALSVLGDGDAIDTGSPRVLRNNDETPPMFRTGLGISVAVKRSSTAKAVSVLGDGNAVDTGCSKVLQNNRKIDENPPMFRTGLGNSFEVKHSSITKALSLMGDCHAVDTGQVHAAEAGQSFSNSLFKTGSGKMVSLSSAGVSKAKSLLGLEENCMFTTDDLSGWGNPQYLENKANEQYDRALGSRSVPNCLINCQPDIQMSGIESKEEVLPNLIGSEKCTSSCEPPAVKFQTAGGRSLSISNDALQRAMSLLGETDFGALRNEGGGVSPLFPFVKESRWTSLNKVKDPAESKFTFKSSLPPKGPHFKEKQGFIGSKSFTLGRNILKEVDANGRAKEGFRKPDSKGSSVLSSSCKDMFNSDIDVENSSEKDSGSGMIPRGRFSGGPLVDISNNIGTTDKNQKDVTCEKRKRGGRSSVSPFKKPRSSRFSTPLNSKDVFLRNGSSTYTPSEEFGCKAKICTRYPFQIERVTVNEFFGGPPRHQNQLEHIPDVVKRMDADTAETYMFHNGSCLNGIGTEAFRHMLTQSRASVQYISREWVANHYKWIVWKLACYERCYPAMASGKYLTVCNVFEELKYRYEREVNHGHRSALKRILEGDASPASMLVLCISAVRYNPKEQFKLEQAMGQDVDSNGNNSSNFSEASNVAKLELTDGWYAVDAILDLPLTKHLISGKLFVGQKLRIWGAGLCGWVGPVSPLESSRTVSLLLHINGTYRTHWDDRLGFCRGPAAPLAFSSIKGAGGLVPRTLVGVKRIYPILYRERLKDGGSIVRSEKMESKMLQLYDQRRSTIAEGIMSEFHKEVSSPHRRNENDSEEGAKIYMILEKAAEPELLMAEMSAEQLNSFATYQAKQEAIRQLDIEKKIEQALEDAGLSERQVTPFMRVRVVGLTSKHTQGKGCCREGLITIWNPTENQQLKLVEGQAYMIEGLIPLNSDSETIYLQARGSTTTWKPLPPSAITDLEPFFSPRKSVFLSNMGDIPLASEFDIGAVVVYVGDLYLFGHQKKQWVFVTDGSIPGSELEFGESPDCLLAISFSSPIIDHDSSAPVNYTLTGSTVGFFNLVKRARDQLNHLWVAEATDNSTYTLSYDLPGCHLKEAARSAHKWAQTSSLAIQKLRERVQYIVNTRDGS